MYLSFCVAICLTQLPQSFGMEIVNLTDKKIDTKEIGQVIATTVIAYSSYSKIATADLLPEMSKVIRYIFIVDNVVSSKKDCIGNPKYCHGFYCGKTSSNNWCKGVFRPKRKEIIYVYKDCIGKTALVHEILHLLAYIAEDWRDHPTDLFTKHCVSGSCRYSTLESRIERKVKEIFCED